MFECENFFSFLGLEVKSFRMSWHSATFLARYLLPFRLAAVGHWQSLMDSLGSQSCPLSPPRHKSAAENKEETTREAGRRGGSHNTPSGQKIVAEEKAETIYGTEGPDRGSHYALLGHKIVPRKTDGTTGGTEGRGEGREVTISIRFRNYIINSSWLGRKEPYATSTLPVCR